MFKILMIVTSHSEMKETNNTTGVWLGEFTDPYYEFVDSGYEVFIASPKGGQPPVDPMSMLTEHITASNRRFSSDETTQAKFNNTLPLAAVNAEVYDAVFIPGGHGPLWDLASSEECGAIIISFLEQKKYISAVCHGPAALLKAEHLQPGLLKGVRITAFTNAEETLVMRSGHVPYLLESKLREAGADFHSAVIPFISHVEEDGLIITGQNPLSSGPTAKLLIKKLQARKHAADATELLKDNVG